MSKDREKVEHTMVKGVIFNIQRYCIHDGPGIRTVVFFKGCTLACQWCSNPESIQAQPQLFYNKSKCILCGNCVRSAPKNLVQFDANGELVINFNELNKRDLSWVECCPTGALDIKGRVVSVEEVYKEVMKDEIYFRKSNGGLTLSGGEALKQAEFAKEIFKLMNSQQISTAIETAGNIPYSSIQMVLPWTSLFLFDFKLYDSEKHKKYIGVNNDLIKENLKRLSLEHDNIHVRMPVIPGVNDDFANLEATVNFLKSIGIKQFSLLPFHQYGSNKYDSIGLNYGFSSAVPPTEESLSSMNEYLLANGFTMGH